MTGLTNQNPANTVVSATEIVTYNASYTKQSSLALDAGLIDDTKLQAFINASGVDPNLFVPVDLYKIEVATNGDINIKFDDIFEEGLILLPLVDGKAYQLDQLHRFGNDADAVLKFATGLSFTKSNVLANRKLVPGSAVTHFIPLIFKVSATGTYPDFTVQAVSLGNTLPTNLAIGPDEIAGSNLTVGWMGVNAITDTQFLPSAASPLKVNLAIRQFLSSNISLTYASTAIVEAFRAIFTDGDDIIDYDDYSNVLTDVDSNDRQMNITFTDEYDVTKTKVLQVYTVPTAAVVELSANAAGADFISLKMNGLSFKASELVDSIVETNGKFYLGIEMPIAASSIDYVFEFSAGGLYNEDTEWTVATWTTKVVQTLPQELVVPVTQLDNMQVIPLANIEGGFKSSVKHMRVEFTVPADNSFAYAFSATNGLTIVDESEAGIFTVEQNVYSVNIGETTLPEGKLLRNTTDAPATLKLYIQVPMAAVTQSIGANYITETLTTAGSTFDGANSEIIVSGERMFLNVNGTNTTQDVTGYSHSYQTPITANKAIKYKFNSLYAQGVFFGNPIVGHMSASLFNGVVTYPESSGLVIDSSGYVFKLDSNGFTELTRIDVRENVYIEYATDAAGTGIVVTQMTYPLDDLNAKPYITNITELPNALEHITGDITLHTSGINIPADTSVYLTDIYDVVKVIPTIECANSTTSFELDVDFMDDGTVQVNDGEVVDIVDWITTNATLTNTTLGLSALFYEDSTRIRLRNLDAFMPEAQLNQENSAYVLYDRFGNVLDVLDNNVYTEANGVRGIRFAGIDVCMSKKPYPEIECDGALYTTDEITITGDVIPEVNGIRLSDTAVDVNELVTLMDAAGIDVIITEE